MSTARKGYPYDRYTLPRSKSFAVSDKICPRSIRLHDRLMAMAGDRYHRWCHRLQISV